MSLTANTIYIPGAVNVFDILKMTASDFDIAGASTFGRFANFRFAIDGTISIGDNAVGADNTVTGRSISNLTGQVININDGGLSTGDILIDHSSDIIIDSIFRIYGNNDPNQDININSNVDVNTGGANTFYLLASNDINVSGVLSTNDDLLLEGNRINVSGSLAVDDILIMTANHHDVSGSASYGRFGYIRFLSDGTVGIGDNATGEDFTVTGDTFSNISGSGVGRMLFNDTGVVTQDILIDHSGSVSHGRRVTFDANNDPNQSIIINSDMSSDVELEFLTGTSGTLNFGGDATLTAPTIDIDNATSLDIAGNDVTFAATSHQYTSPITSSIADSGTVIFTYNNNAHSLGIDSAGSNVNFTSAGVLGLVDSTVENIQVGNQSNTGGVNLGSGWGGLLSDNNVIARTGGDINMAGAAAVSKTTGADTNLILIADDSITLTSSSITSTLGELEVTLHADADNDDAG